jgi:hypothetical protein
VGKSGPYPDAQKTIVIAESPSPGYSSTSQEHILEPDKSDIVRTVVVDVSYADHSRLAME